MADELLDRDPEQAQRLLARGPRAPPAPRSATCGRWCAASTRRCSPTAAWPARSQALALDMAIPVRGARAACPGGPRRRSSRRSTSPSPSAWPTSASTPGPSTPGSSSPTTDGVLTAVVGDDGRGGADPGAGTGMLGVMRRLAAFDGTMRRVEPGRRARRRHPGGPVRLVLAEDHALLRAGLIRLLEAHGFTILAAVDNAPALDRALQDPDGRRRRARRTPAADVHRRGAAAPRSRSARRGRASRCMVLSQYVEQLYARELLASGAGCGRLPAQGPGLRRGGVRRRRPPGRRRRHRPRPRGGRDRDGPPAGTSRSTGSPPREREVLALMAEGRSNAAIAAALSSPRRPSPSTSTASSPSSTCPSPRTTTAGCAPCSPGWVSDRNLSRTAVLARHGGDPTT